MMKKTLCGVLLIAALLCGVAGAWAVDTDETNQSGSGNMSETNEQQGQADQKTSTLAPSIRHISHAALIDGKAVYGEEFLHFVGVRLMLNGTGTNEKVTANHLQNKTGTLTLPAGTYRPNGIENPVTIPADATSFTLQLPGDAKVDDELTYNVFYAPNGESAQQVYEFQALTTTNDDGDKIEGETTGLEGAQITWAFTDDNLTGQSGSATLPTFITTSAQLTSGVPYVELTRDSSGKVTGITARVVKAATPATAEKAGEKGARLKISANGRESDWAKFNSGDALQTTMTLDSAVAEANLGTVSVRFDDRTGVNYIWDFEFFPQGEKKVSDFFTIPESNTVYVNDLLTFIIEEEEAEADTHLEDVLLDGKSVRSGEDADADDKAVLVANSMGFAAKTPGPANITVVYGKTTGTGDDERYQRYYTTQTVTVANEPSGSGAVNIKASVGLSIGDFADERQQEVEQAEQNIVGTLEPDDYMAAEGVYALEEEASEVTVKFKPKDNSTSLPTVGNEVNRAALANTKLLRRFLMLPAGALTVKATPDSGATLVKVLKVGGAEEGEENAEDKTYKGTGTTFKGYYIQVDVQEQVVNPTALLRVAEDPEDNTEENNSDPQDLADEDETVYEFTEVTVNKEDGSVTLEAGTQYFFLIKAGDAQKANEPAAPQEEANQTPANPTPVTDNTPAAEPEPAAGNVEPTPEQQAVAETAANLVEAMDAAVADSDAGKAMTEALQSDNPETQAAAVDVVEALNDSLSTEELASLSTEEIAAAVENKAEEKADAAAEAETGEVADTAVPAGTDLLAASENVSEALKQANESLSVQPKVVAPAPVTEEEVTEMAETLSAIDEEAVEDENLDVELVKAAAENLQTDIEIGEVPTSVEAQAAAVEAVFNQVSENLAKVTNSTGTGSGVVIATVLPALTPRATGFFPMKVNLRNLTPGRKLKFWPSVAFFNAFVSGANVALAEDAAEGDAFFLDENGNPTTKVSGNAANMSVVPFLKEGGDYSTAFITADASESDLEALTELAEATSGTEAETEDTTTASSGGGHSGCEMGLGALALAAALPLMLRRK